MQRHDVTLESISKLFDEISSKPLISLVGTLLAIIFPIDGWSITAVGTLIAIDTVTGRWAAMARGEEVRSRYTFRKLCIKLQGYMVFVITAALASLASHGLVGDSMMFLRGSIGLLGAIEFFSITENSYDLGWIAFDPRRVPFFKGLITSIKLRKRKDPEQTP